MDSFRSASSTDSRSTRVEQIHFLHALHQLCNRNLESIGYGLEQLQANFFLAMLQIRDVAAINAELM